MTNEKATVDGAPNRKYPRARGVVRLERVQARINTDVAFEWSDEIKAEIAAAREAVHADLVRRAYEGDASAAKALMVW